MLAEQPVQHAKVLIEAKLNTWW